MTGDQQESAAGVYELTVTGDLGDVLRWAVRPHGVTRAGTTTVLHAVVSHRRDLVDLLATLDAHDVTLQDVFLIGPSDG